MADESLACLTVQDLAGKIQRKEVSPLEVIEAVLARIERLNPEINAFTTVTADLAREAARATEKEIVAGRYRGPFHGIPVGIKDLTNTAGIRTTYGSASWQDYVPTEDAEIREVRLPHKDLVLDAILKIFSGEFALWHRVMSHFRQITYSPDVARWIVPALALTMDDYLKAQLDRERVRYDYAMVFAEVEVLLCPTQAFPAPAIGQERIALGGRSATSWRPSSSIPARPT